MEISRTSKKTAASQESLKAQVKCNYDVQVVPVQETYNPEVSCKIQPSKTWDADLKKMTSSSQWLKEYGLKKNRLDEKSLYASLGFTRVEGYNDFLKKPVTSKYGESLFLKHFKEATGQTVNIVARKDQLKQVEERLKQAVELYRSRLDWLTTESRRIFGVIEEHCVTIILDIKNMAPRAFDMYICAAERVILEQVREIAKFNLIRCQEDICYYNLELVPVTKDSITLAVDWLWSQDRLAKTGPTNTIEALNRAAVDPACEAIYLFTEGTSSENSREVLRDKVKLLKIPLHVISYNCVNKDTLDFLRSLCVSTGGRFHAYAVNLELDSYEAAPLDVDQQQANIVIRRRLYGGVPGGSGRREDCVELFEELESARNMLQQIQLLLSQIPDPKLAYESTVEHDNASHDRRDEYMSSKEWLDKSGLKARKLDFYDVLAGVCFKHCDGVVDVMHAPSEVDISEQQNAVVASKLVNARYCDKFAHVMWKDGTLVHVQISPEVYRLYEQRMNACLDAIKRRINWLRQGSRELFGTIMEEQVYILIDTSASMAPSLDFVKDKLYILMQEQLRHKSKVNFVAFNTRANPWRDHAVDATESNLQAAWEWVKSLACAGSTNTLSALKFALSDRSVHGIYLLSDGRPDQPPKTVLAQVQLHHRVPVHTISFNCSDSEANKFLKDLAKETGARFHYFSELADDPAAPETWESEDIRLLKAEYQLGKDNVEKMNELRDECQRLAWTKDTYDNKEELKQKLQASKRRSGTSRRVGRGKDSELPALRGAKTSQRSFRRKPRSAPAVNGDRSSSPQTELFEGAIYLHDAKMTDPYYSFLQSLNRSNTGSKGADDWMLPETREILERQDDRYTALMQDTEKTEQKQKRSKPAAPKKSESMTVTQWLHLYGLVAQHMTILDILAPTVVRVRPRYIPIIQKSVTSRVFEKILPVAHVSPGTTDQHRATVRLVNPEAVDLPAYREKLAALLKRYERKLNQLSRAGLSEEAIAEILQRSGSSELDYEKHRELIHEYMENEGWLVDENDFELVYKELITGRKYYQQALELEEPRRALEQERRRQMTEGRLDKRQQQTQRRTKQARQKQQPQAKQAEENGDTGDNDKTYSLEPVSRSQEREESTYGDAIVYEMVRTPTSPTNKNLA